MIKKTVLYVLAFTTLLSIVALCASAQEGNARKGKYLYRNSCRECHKEGAAATPLSPDSKTQAQWERAFKPENNQALACKDEWAKHSEGELQDIFTYLYEHAYDSPSPAKCK